jgi:uncharacterized protein (DUF1810 family)
MSRLERFRLAQRSQSAGYAAALAEIRSGRKVGHWIWYVLPQIRGLGSSEYSLKFGIQDRDEAVAYLRDPELRAHLLEITQAVAERLRRRSPATLRGIMGSHIDAQKTVSSLTLFGRIAHELGDVEIAQAAEEVLALAAAEGYPACGWTLQSLGETE